MSSGAAAEAPAGGSAGGGSGGGGGNKVLLIVVLAFNVLIAAGLGYQVLIGQGKIAAGHIKGEGKEGGGDGKEAGPPAPRFGPLVEIGSMVANMSGPLSGHYAKVFVHVEVPDDKAKVRVEGALVPIRSESLLFFSSIELKDATGQDQIRALAEELKEKLNALVGKDTIRRVYFSEFVIQ